ncbi:MAG: zinc ribbon domain-containing protein [Chloroflexi bacterium]|nr:zinc ribbon domain-containing protein [Chloroflexota bacterium]
MFADLAPETLRTLAMLATAWAVAFGVALWLATLVWTWRDIRARTRDPLLRLLALLVVAVLFLPGVAVYWLLRPPLTLEEEYRRALEEEALLQALDETRRCPGCARRIEPDWIVCPHCHTKLRKVCHHCQRLLELPWNLCPYCGTPVPGMRREDLSLDEILESASPPEAEPAPEGPSPEDAIPSASETGPS